MDLHISYQDEPRADMLAFRRTSTNEHEVELEDMINNSSTS